MVDHVKVLGARITYPKAVLTALGFFFLMWFIPVAVIRESIAIIPFENWILFSWFTINGGWLFLEGLASWPDAKKGSSKIGAYFMVGFGFLSMTFGIIGLFTGMNILLLDPAIQTLVAITLGIGFIVFLVHLFPELIHRKSFVQALN